MKGGKDKARSPHYFVQITHAAVICKIPVILHFKLENKTAWLAAAYPLHGISMLSPPVTLTLLRKTDPTTAENYCTALRSVRIIFSSLSLSLSFSFFLRSAILRTPPSPALHFRVRSPRPLERSEAVDRRGQRESYNSQEDCARKFEILSTGSRRNSNLINVGALAVLDSVPKKRTLASSCGHVSNYERYLPFVGGVSGAISRVGMPSAKWGLSVQVHVTRTSKPWTWSNERRNERGGRFSRIKRRNSINLFN